MDGKLLSLLCFMIFIFQRQITVFAHVVPRLRWIICYENDNYTRNSTYERNLDITLSTLPTTDSQGLGFFNSSVGQGTDTVNSSALCRGDIRHDLCLRCLNVSIATTHQKCPLKKGAVVYYDECWLSYFNLHQHANLYDIFSQDKTAQDPDRFKLVVRSLLDELVEKATTRTMTGRKFAIGNTTGPGSITIYGFVQCIPTLSKEECINCLKNEITRFAKYGRSFKKVGGRYFDVTCTFGYDVFPFSNMLM